MAAPLTCNDSFHGILEVGGIDGFVPFPGSVQSSFIADICYVSSCKHEFTRVTLGLNGTENSEEGGMSTNLEKDLRKSNSLCFLFLGNREQPQPMVLMLDLNNTTALAGNADTTQSSAIQEQAEAKAGSQGQGWCGQWAGTGCCSAQPRREEKEHLFPVCVGG